MKYVCLFLLLSSNALLCAQDYFSTILPTTDNALIKTLHKVDDTYIMPCDFSSTSGVQGGLIIFNEEGEIENSKYENMNLSADPLAIVDNSYFFLGENPFREGDSTFFITKLSEPGGDQIWYKEYSVISPKHNPRTILSIGNSIFVIHVELETLVNYPQETSLYEFNHEGDLLNIHRYNTDKWASFARQSFITSDESILISCLSGEDEIGPKTPIGQVIKLNKEGEIIWNYEGTEELANGAVPTWATELSDSSILQTYYVDRRNDVDFIVNQWFREPNKFIWLNKDGEFIKEKYIITDKEDFLYYGGVKNGEGDYFYAYGYHEDTRPVLLDQIYAHLTKFSNSGDTIWSRNYQHPSYAQGNVIHNIKDIIEEENGDITILARITPQAEKSEVWLYRVNSDGCYLNEECEDMRDLTSINTPQSSNVTISPNPTSGLINVESSTNIKKIKLIEITGKPIKNITVNSKSVDFDLLDVDEGIYILQVIDEFSKTINKKIIKM